MYRRYSSMGLRSSKTVKPAKEMYSKKCTPTVENWYSADNMDDLKQNVKLWNILEIELRQELPQWALFIGSSGNDLQIAQSFHDNELRTASLRKVIGDSRVRISNERVSFPNAALDNNEITVNIMFHVMSHFLGNRSMTPFIRSLVKERQLSGEQEEYAESEIKLLVEEALFHLIGLAGRGLGGQVEQNKGKKSDWFKKNHIKQLESESRVGDRLEFKSGRTNSRWGIYIGQIGDNLLVLHFSSDGSGEKVFGRESLGQDNPAYRIDTIEKLLVDHKVRINNELDRERPPLEPDDILDGIVHRLASQTFKGLPDYSVFCNNCEHLVNEFRYSKHHHCEHVSTMVGEGANYSYKERGSDSLVGGTFEPARALAEFGRSVLEKTAGTRPTNTALGTGSHTTYPSGYTRVNNRPPELDHRGLLSLGLST